MSLLAAYLATLGGAGGGGGGDPVVALADVSISDFSGDVAFSGYYLTSTGGVGSETSVDGYTVLGSWVAPSSAAPGTYECRADVVFGTITGSATGSWLALTTTRSWFVEALTPGTFTGRITVSIRDGGTTLATATIDLSARAAPSGGGIPP